MKSVSRILATMKSLPVFLFLVFMMITNLLLIYQAEPFGRKGETAIINIYPKTCGQTGKSYF